MICVIWFIFLDDSWRCLICQGVFLLEKKRRAKRKWLRLFFSPPNDKTNIMHLVRIRVRNSFHSLHSVDSVEQRAKTHTDAANVNQISQGVQVPRPLFVIFSGGLARRRFGPKPESTFRAAALYFYLHVWLEFQLQIISLESLPRKNIFAD